MSRVINNGDYQAGCIYRIALENFVTYKRVELFPGPSLNLIIGPNGTGKSTFVCAIILGLCGKTSVIGRAKKISEFVRSGCQNSTIEIELFREQGQRNVIITRNFDLNDGSTWSIDCKTVREKQVQELIASMNIQVDNLCQLLPQDRVQDFSKMNPQELLRSTLSAVGKMESVSQLDELIQCRQLQRKDATKQQNSEQSIEEKIRLNERLKVKIDEMQQRKEVEKEIQICENKKLWLEYSELREKCMEYTRDKKEALKIVNQRKTELEPMEKVIETSKNEIRKLEQLKLNSTKPIFSLKDTVDKTLASIREKEYELKNIEAAYQNKLERHSNRERELMESNAFLEKLNLDERRLKENVGDDATVKMEMAELQRSIVHTNAGVELLKKQKLEMQFELDNKIVPHIRACENKIRTLEDVNLERLETLRRYSPDSYKAVLWLRENRHLFRSNVHEPMMLEINFTEPKFARYLETTISNRDLVAFTFESTQDMNLFLQKVRQEQGLKRVNALCSQGGALELPVRDIQQISYLGFYTYLVDTISAPDAITRYLCKNYNIHKIPIGNDHTYKNSGKVPANIRYFFTENHRFTVRVSAYSGEKSSTTIEIPDPRLLANTVDDDEIQTLNNKLVQLQNEERKKRSDQKNIDHKVSILESNLNEFNKKRKAINEGMEKLRTISAQIRLQKKKIADMENDPTFDIEQEKLRCRRKQKDCVLKQINLQNDLKTTVKNLCSQIQTSDILKVKLDISRNSIIEQESSLRELRTELGKAEAILKDVETRINRTKINAKEKLLEAKRNSNNKMYNDPDFPNKEEFENLPSDINSLQERCHELQTRMDCMDPGDEQIIAEYEERERQIADLKAEAQNSSASKLQLEKKMAKIKSQWLPRLEKLLEEINRNFGEMFSKLQCAGEIKLETGECDEDYDKYGISILVRFRESEQLQQLTRFAQSGGERALTTAVYLMALQGLTTVPFRCVDEINQGMDEINERKMFELLVQVTTQCDRAQYFLLTPKLLSKLHYNDQTMVHTIMNGANIMKNRRWQYQTFLDNARKHYATS